MDQLDSSEAWYKIMPTLGGVRSPCVDIQCVYFGRSDAVWQVLSMIIHLNDYHKWTREEIADWLDTLDVDLRLPTPEVG